MNGILLLNKPQGLTSNAALQRVKRLLNVKKAGHTGSLDPLATGMLPICLGEATKFSQYLLDADKIYEAEGRLGMTTTTGDAEGEALQICDATHIDISRLMEVLHQFLGKIQQIPPMFSALKQQGVPLYKLARQGREVVRQAREVCIHELQFLSFEDLKFRIRVRCSKGTYIRTLVEDIGEKLGVGAHVTVLHRVATAGFDAEPMYTLEEIAHAPILPMERALVGLPTLRCSDVQKKALYHGQILMIDATSGELQLLDEAGHLFGVGVSDGHELRVKRLLNRN